jgi:hypothetical protein
MMIDATTAPVASWMAKASAEVTALALEISVPQTPIP